MNKAVKFAVAGAVAMLLGSATLALADDAPPQGHVSPASAKDLQAANKALQAKNYDEVIADLDKVKANDKRNDYDDYVMNEFYVRAYIPQKKYPEALAAVEAVMASKYVPPADLKLFRTQAAAVAYTLKNYDKTIEFGNAAIKDGTSTTELNTMVAQAYFLKDDFKGTDGFVRTMVDGEVKAGETPTEAILLLGISASEKMTDEAGEKHWLELLVAYYPKPGYWQNLLQDMYTNKLTDRQLLQLYRLSADVGAMKNGSEFADMAQLSLAAGNPGEAISTLNAGFAANAFANDAEKKSSQHLLDSAKKQAATDQPTLAKSEADGATAATGDRLVGAGIGYYGYGDYARAAKDISAGLAKGMSKDSTDARLLLGIAQLKSGDKASAVQSFQQVKGDPISEQLAALWILHAKA